jgi:type II secretory pathway component PulF
MMPFSWPTLDASRKLSAEEATELASRVADLTKAGLPLDEGLRALAAELPGRRLPYALNVLAYRLEIGDSLDAAIASIGPSLPPHLRGLMLAGLRSGHLAEALEEYVDMERTQSEMRRRLLSSLLYPFFLLCVLTGVLVLFRQVVMGPFVKIFLDFNCTLPKLTEMFICGFYYFWPVLWGMVILLCLLATMPLVMAAAPRASLLWWVLCKIPMLGPLLRWSQVAHFARLMGLLTEQSVPLPDALRLTSGGLRDANLALGCRRAAEDVDKGQPLVGSLADKPQFPASMIPLIGWGQQTPALPDAFRAIAEMFEGRVRSQGSLLEALLLPVMFLTIITVVGLFVIAMFLPLINLIQKLSG